MEMSRDCCNRSITYSAAEIEAEKFVIRATNSAVLFEPSVSETLTRVDRADHRTTGCNETSKNLLISQYLAKMKQTFRLQSTNYILFEVQYSSLR